jgi:hypothetical protein
MSRAWRIGLFTKLSEKEAQCNVKECKQIIQTTGGNTKNLFTHARSKNHEKYAKMLDDLESKDKADRVKQKERVGKHFKVLPKGNVILFMKTWMESNLGNSPHYFLPKTHFSFLVMMTDQSTMKQ